MLFTAFLFPQHSAAVEQTSTSIVICLQLSARRAGLQGKVCIRLHHVTLSRSRAAPWRTSFFTRQFWRQTIDLTQTLTVSWHVWAWRQTLILLLNHWNWRSSICRDSRNFRRWGSACSRAADPQQESRRQEGASGRDRNRSWIWNCWHGRRFAYLFLVLLLLIINIIITISIIIIIMSSLVVLVASNDFYIDKYLSLLF